jgi:hypothetical protein
MQKEKKSATIKERATLLFSNVIIVHYILNKGNNIHTTSLRIVITNDDHQIMTVLLNLA